MVHDLPFLLENLSSGSQISSVDIMGEKTSIDWT